MPNPEGVDSKMVAEPFEVLIEMENADSGILRRDGDGEIGEGKAMGAMGAASGQVTHQRDDPALHASIDRDLAQSF